MVSESKSLDYVHMLRALQEIPFPVGKKLLFSFLSGDESHDSIKKHTLSRFESFGSLLYDKDELEVMLDFLVRHKCISHESFNGNKYWKVLSLTPRGEKEIVSPSLHERKVSFNGAYTSTTITEEDRRLFSSFDFFLGSYDDFQKKAILSQNNHILCVAGAGSGKTTVLTKRIEFLVRFKSVDPQSILAITFTRKARREMELRLKQLNVHGVHVETFNSFCEKILKKHNDLLYDTHVKVLGYREKMRVFLHALQQNGYSVEKALETYFTFGQRRGKTQDQLLFIFMNDCFTILDYYKQENKPIQNFAVNATTAKQKEMASMVHTICSFIETYMKKEGLRDFADQLVDALRLFREHKDVIPSFSHVLIDEYQDVNSIQIALVEELNAPHFFCVGDPRQSIYGWRGSRIGYILDFEERYSTGEVISLVHNYRSSESIVGTINLVIKKMGLPDLKSNVSEGEGVRLIHFESEEAEYAFVVQSILHSDIAREEMFVLARTNKQLVEISSAMKRHGIAHVVRSDELRKSVMAQEGDVTLATVHAIKGLEAECVFVVGCGSQYFPCKASDHPIVDMAKLEEYDSYEEERRLLYVALSRAKKRLVLSYSGKYHSRFITPETKGLLDVHGVTVQQALEDSDIKIVETVNNDVVERIKKWRTETSKRLGVKPYMILHDKTIFALASQNPTHVSDLHDVKGLGPAKIAQFGEEILSLL